jgi:hypothetical protein
MDKPIFGQDKDGKRVLNHSVKVYMNDMPDNIRFEFDRLNGEIEELKFRLGNVEKILLIAAQQLGLGK